MINLSKIKKPDIVLLAVLLFYISALIFNIRGEYRSGDEMGFLTGFSDRDGADKFDWRYILWTSYILATTSIHTSLPIILNVVAMALSLRILVDKRIFSYLVPVGLLLAPTVFYFLNSYLRDSAFMFTSCMLLGLLARKEALTLKQLIAVWILIAIIGIMRPFYGSILVCSFLLSHCYFSKYLSFILGFMLTVFIATAGLVAFNHEAYLIYFDFFEFGHLRERWDVGVMSIPRVSFTFDLAAVNFLFSPLFFWIVPAPGFGHLYDWLIFIENLCILLLFVLAVRRYRDRLLRDDRAFRMAWVGFMFSLFMAAATTTHLDSYRFRLMFLPFLAYIALANRPASSTSHYSKLQIIQMTRKKSIIANI